MTDERASTSRTETYPDHGRHESDRTSAADRAAVDHQRDEYGGINWGSAFFGWLVAVGITILLSSVIGAIAAALGSEANLTQSDAEQRAGTIGIVAAAVLLAVLLVGYYAGGYVAGRMSRFDGGKQGLAVWLIGLVVTVLAAALGWIFGSEYNILDRVSLPSIPVPTDQLGWGGLITGLVILIGTLLAAIAGGKVGQRYHRKVDEAGYRY